MVFREELEDDYEKYASMSKSKLNKIKRAYEHELERKKERSLINIMSEKVGINFRNILFFFTILLIVFFVITSIFVFLSDDYSVFDPEVAFILTTNFMLLVFTMTITAPFDIISLQNRINKITFLLDSQNETQQFSRKTALIIVALQENKEGLNKADIRKYVQNKLEKTISRNTLNEHLNLLINNGVVSVSGKQYKGKYSGKEKETKVFKLRFN